VPRLRDNVTLIRTLETAQSLPSTWVRFTN
jgi:hypothetical protein